MRSAAESSPIRNGRRRGERWIVRVPHEGHTSGSCARSAAMSASASGARYSLIPRLPTATSLRTEIYTTLILTHFPGGGPPFLTPPGGTCSLPPPLPPLSCQPSPVVRKFRHYWKPYPASPACCAVPWQTRSLRQCAARP